MYDRNTEFRVINNLICAFAAINAIISIIIHWSHFISFLIGPKHTVNYWKRFLWYLKAINPVETLTIVDVTKTECNNCLITHWTTKQWKSCFCSFTDGKQHIKALELENDYPQKSCTVVARWRHRRCFRKFTVRFRPIRKEKVGSMCNKPTQFLLYPNNQSLGKDYPYLELDYSGYHKNVIQ